MHTNPRLPHPGPHENPSSVDLAARRPERLNWALIAGLSALALLWPLAELTGVPGGLGRSATLIAVTALCWIGIVGFGRFPHPVMTLTLTGIGWSIVTHSVSLIFNGFSIDLLWTTPISLAMQAGWGALSGLIAWGIQAALPRRGNSR